VFGNTKCILRLDLSKGVRDTSGELKTDGVHNNVDIMEQVCEIVD
jgi:hypothetical protein